MIASAVQKRLIRVVLTLLLASSASACMGWSLRGYSNASADRANSTLPDAIDLDFKVRDYQLISAFKLILERYDIRDDENAQTKLIILSERLERQPIAFTETGIAAQYQLELSMTYRVIRDGTSTDRSARGLRSYDFDPVRISSEAAEEQKLKTELRQELFVEILNRLAQTRRVSDEESGTSKQPVAEQLLD